MASLFAITTPTDRVALENNRQGQLSFTVSNTTARFVRGHARVSAQPATAAEWLKLMGDEERDFNGNESQQYTVKIAPPSTADPGEYTFRLNIVDVADPDETLTEGPSVRFTVPVPPVAKPKPFPWWLVAAVIGAIILIVGGSVGVYLASRPPVVSVTPSPTLPSPTIQVDPTPSFVPTSWTGNGTFYSNKQQFDMQLTIVTVNDPKFTGTLEEKIYSTTVSITGQITGTSGEGIEITFTTVSYIHGNSICLQCVYKATIADGQMQGIWHYPGHSTPDGNIDLKRINP